MNDIFERRVRAAAIAGWWTLLIAAIFLAVQWIAYLFVMHAHPAWLLSLVGPDISWSYIQNVWFWMVTVFKVCLWLMAMVVIWLTLWSRQLRKKAGG